MPAKKRRKRLRSSAHEPGGLRWWMRRYLDWLKVHNYSESTLEHRDQELELFAVWSEARSIMEPREVTRPILERYQRQLFHQRKKNGRPLSFSVQAGRLGTVRGYFRWLGRQSVLLANPASDLELPRVEKRLPRHVLTAAEAERVLALPNVFDVLGLRDRAILETLYSTGIRRTELAGLALYDLDLERGTLLVRLGKGKKDRVIPIGERAIAWIQRYLDASRPELVVLPDEGVVFLGQRGDGLSPVTLTHLVGEYVETARLGKSGSCHMFRHTMATLMLEGGADIRFIQQMLGHSEIRSTAVYTHVAIRKLREVHAATHPGARLGRATRGSAPTLPLVAIPDGRLERPDGLSERPAMEEIFSLLAAEHDAETTDRDEAETAEDDGGV